MASRESVRILIGTRKGGYVVEGDPSRKKWRVGKPCGEGSDVFHMASDPRHPGRLYAAVNNGFWGPMVLQSTNWGKTWKETPAPLTPMGKDRKPLLNEESPTTPVPRPVNNLWHIEPGPASEPDELFLGVDPHALYVSDNLGGSWEPVQGINQHPTKPRWNPGAGGPCLHTIILDPANPRTRYVGISAAGMFKSSDGGRKWYPVNKNVATPFLPGPPPEVGQCVHKVVLEANDPKVAYRQDHGGIYVSHDAMESWDRIGKTLPDDFGFCVATAKNLPGRAYFVPLKGNARTTPNGGFEVMEWNDKSRKWRSLLSPKRYPGQFGVHREGIACDALDPAGIYVGTTNGKVFWSPDAGASWDHLPYDFPAIHSVAVSGPSD